MSQLGQLTSTLRSHGIEPVAIAVTATFSQIAFGDTLGVDFPMLSDWGGEVAASYGVRYDQWKGHVGVAKRSVFLIGRDGLIAYKWITDDALVEPDFDEIMRAAASLGPSA